jgi:AraC-like DNA-binding protein
MKKVLQELTKSQNASIIVKEEIAAQFAAPFHFHKGFEFTYIVKGRGKFYGGNRLLNFNSGELYLFGVGFPHLFVNEKSFVESGEAGHSVIIQFDEDLFSHDFALIPEFNLVKAILKMSCWGIKIARPNVELQKHISAITQKKGLQIIISLLQIFDIISTIPKSDITIIASDALKNTKLSSHYDGRLAPVFQYVLAHFKNKITTQKAASLVFMNEAAFCRYFKRRTNKTLSQFVNHIRITHALYLLSEKTKSISDICYECGFENLSYFNRQFKTITGKTPLHYRQL